MTAKNSLQDGQIKSVPIFDFQNFLFQIVSSLRIKISAKSLKCV
jgi:hypothetical protein